jgi:hypothetical protein
MSEATLAPLASNLWAVSKPLPLIIGDIGCRMTVVRLSDGKLLLHSPIALDDSLRRQLDGLGEVGWLVGPSRAHHLFLGDYARAYPSAQLCGAPGLPEKREDLRFHHVLEEGAALWRGDLVFRVFRGAPMMNEVVFFHPSSRTLILTDLAFHLPPGARNRARAFHWLVGATGRFGPHRLIRLGIRDRKAARASLEELLTWDFDRVILSHGDILEQGGKERMRSAFSFLG